VGSKKAKAKASPKARSAAKTKPATHSANVTHADAVAATAFQPIEDRVLIAVEEASETTAGGIIIPGNVESRPHRGTVLAKGPGRRGKKGQIRPLDVNVGDHVLFPEHAGSKIQIAGDDFLILREDELLGIVTV
jgi:chaperonin GroES